MLEATAERYVRVLVCDPSNSMHRGALRAVTMDSRGRRNDSHPAAHLADQLLAEGRPTGARPVAIAPYLTSPVDSVRSDVERRDLTVGEAHWLTSLPEPAALSDRECTALATLAATVKSPAERAMVAAKLAPVRALHDARKAARKLEVEIAAMPVARNPMAGPNGATPESWERMRKLIADELRAEHPELGPEAEVRAERMVLDRFQVAGVEASQAREAKRAELGDLLRTHGLVSKYFPEAHRWGVAGDPGYRPPVDPQEQAA